MRKLAIFGASGHGLVVADAAESTLRWDMICFYDDKWPALNRNKSWGVVGNFEMLLANLRSFDGIVVAIGNNEIRYNKINIIKKMGGHVVSVVHSRSAMSSHVLLGEGSVVMANAVINIGATLDIGVIVNTGAIIDHDCQVGICAHISPGANVSGNVIVGDRGWIGVGATIKQGIRIGASAIVGAGAVVINDVPVGSVVVGNPARSLVKS